MSDFGLASFKASPLGLLIQAIIELPETITEMKVLAKYGFPPVLALDERLAHLRPDVGVREVNSQIGRWAYELIGEAVYEVAGRSKIGGLVFETGATFKPRPKEAYRIERLTPRPGGTEYPVKGPRGYELVAPGLKADQRTKSANAEFVATLAEAIPYLDRGYHIRMGRKGVRASLIGKDSLKITKA